MEEMSAPRDLREWIARVEAIGQIHRINEEVDWNEEMGAITYMAHQEIGAPALLFEKIKGCRPGFTALWNSLGSSPDRVRAVLHRDISSDQVEAAISMIQRAIPALVKS